jgi:hypothetical protein
VRTCGYGVRDGVVCGSTTDVALYPCGLRCPDHSPATIAGRTVPTPDPARSMAGLMARPRPIPPDRYGTLTTDPLGRTVTVGTDGKRFADKLPRRPCPSCTRPGYRPPVGHKGDHTR